MVRLITILVILSVLSACEAPHNNPMDPQNPDYRYARITGVVQTVSLPSAAIPQVLITWQPGVEQRLSDQQGKYEMLLYNPVNGWLSFFHKDFHPDSFYVDWSAEKEVNIAIYLNALPQLDSLAIYSVVLNRFPSLQKEQLVIETHISDPDNDIDSVRAIFSEPAQAFHLPYNTSEKSFRREFSILELGVFTIEEWVGKPVQIGITDIFANYLIAGQSQLVRVIRDQVLFVSPAEDSTTGATPILVWQSFDPGFNFYYDVEIYTNEVAPQRVWRQAGLTMEQTNVSVDTELADGSYFWVIWAIDTFGNRTRSKPAAFNVQGG